MSLASSLHVLCATLTASIMAGCGGSAIVDSTDGGDGSGGKTSSAASTGGKATTGGGTSSGSTTSPGGTTGGRPTSCERLEERMLEAYEEAVACSPFIDVIQCSGMNVAKSYCDCEVVANDSSPEAAARSLALGNRWRDEGCEYNFCESGCQPTNEAWFCDPDTRRCTPFLE